MIIQYIIPLLAFLFFKEFIILNQEIIIYTTFLTLTIIFINTFNLSNVFNNMRSTIKTDLNSSSSNLQKRDISIKNKFYDFYNVLTNIEIKLPNIKNLI